MMNSQFNEKELLKLYKKFSELDEDNHGELTNRQLLNLPEFRFTPFRSRLFYALQLKSDNQVFDQRA
jgi:Ca2+-binding EF-hand superfamily protein